MSKGTRWSQFRPYLLPLSFTLGGCGIAVGLLVGVSDSLAVDRTSSCPVKVRGLPDPAGPLQVYVTEPGPAKLGPPDKTALISFKESRRPAARRATLASSPRLHDAVDETPPEDAKLFRIRAEFEEELTGPNDTTLSQRPGFRITKQVTDAGNLRICLELDPRKSDGIAASSYEGTLRISSKPQAQLEEYPLHVTAVFRNSRTSAILAAVLGFAFGLLTKMLSELAAGQQTKKLDALVAYMSQWSYVLTFFGGALTVTLAYVQLYSDNAHWGSSDWDWLKLFSTCVAGQLSSTGVADLAKRAVEGRPTAT